MHADELDISVELAAALVDVQFPEWRELPLTRVDSFGTDNALFRLGDRMVVRLPRIEWAVDGAVREYEWLPRLAPHLPVELPAPLARAEPTDAYPWPWFVYSWLEGENPPLEADFLADDLAAFIAALHAIDTRGAPTSRRGVPLATQDALARKAIAGLEGVAETGPLEELWEHAVRAPEWSGPSRWLHGDLISGNLLVRSGRLTGVIDFAVGGIGDPAADLFPAWALFGAATRERFRHTLRVDDATWTRAQGWAVIMAAMALPYYQETNALLASTARRILRELVVG